MINGRGSILRENKYEASQGGKADNRGTSMISVIISFTLLLLLIAGYFQIQRLTENMMLSAKDVSVNNRRLISAFYLEETKDDTVAEDTVLEFSSNNGSFIVEATLNRATKDGLNGSIYYFGKRKEEPEEP